MSKLSSSVLSSSVFVANTDTIAGVFTNIHNDIGIRKIYQIKSRDYSKPLALYAANIEILMLIIDITERDRRIIDQSKYQNTTFIIPLKAKIPFNNQLYKNNAVGIRLPNHNNFHAGGIMSEGIFCGTSANISGCAQKLDMPVQGSSNLGSGRPSTIINLIDNSVLKRD